MAITASYITTRRGATSATSRTFTGTNIGAAETGRIVLVCVSTAGASGSRTTGVTLGGVSMTLAAENTNVNTLRHESVYYLKVDAGTAADITITFSSSSPVVIDVVALYGATDTLKDTAVDADVTGVSSASTSRSATVTVDAGDAVFAYFSSRGIANPSTVSWTGIAELSESQVGITTIEMQSTAFGEVVATGDLTASVTCSDANGVNPGLIVVAFSPAVTGVTADLNATLGTLTATGSTSVEIEASATNNLAALTASAAATSIVAADVSKTLGALTGTAGGSVDTGATTNQALGALTGSAAGAVTASADLNSTLEAAAAEAFGNTSASAELSATLGAVTLVADATLATVRNADLNVTLGSVALVSSGVVDIVRSAELNVTLGEATATSKAVVGVKVNITQTLGALAVASSAGVDTTANAGVTLGGISALAGADAYASATVDALLGAIDAAAGGKVIAGATLAVTLGELVSEKPKPIDLTWLVKSDHPDLTAQNEPRLFGAKSEAANYEAAATAGFNVTSRPLDFIFTDKAG